MAETLESAMNKALKLSVMGFNLAKLKQVFEAIDWVAEEQLVEIHPRFVNKDIEQLTGIPSFVFNLSKDKSAGYEICLYHYDKKEVENQKIYEACKELVKLPKSKKKFSHNFYSVSEPTIRKPDAKDDFKVDRFVFNLDYRLTVPGMKVISKNGKTFTVNIKGFRDKSLNNSELVEWLKNETTFVAEIAEHLGVEPPEKRKQVARTRENTGTCGICGHQQKLDKRGNLVHHGFTKPGHGYIQGDCFGVGYQPYELSNKACIAYVDRLQIIKKQTQAALNRHESGKVETLQVQDKTYKLIMGRRIYDLKTVNKGTPEFDAAQKVAIANLRNEVRNLEHDIEAYTKRATDWKLDVLPWDKLQAKLKRIKK